MGLVKIPDKAEVIQDHHYEVSRILGHKNTAGKAAAKYLVRWVGFDSGRGVTNRIICILLTPPGSD
jgi:hypothetical protein